MNINTVIIDDEQPSINNIKTRLKEYVSFNLVDEYKTVSEALKGLKSQSIDLIFLDIQMPKFNGFDFLRKYKPEKMPLIVFITAYNEFALKAFDFHAVDYLLKPIQSKRFEETIMRISGIVKLKNERVENIKLTKLINYYEESENSKTNQQITVKSLDSYYNLNVLDILFIQSDGDFITIHTKTDKYFVRSSLKSFLKKLAPNQFKQVSRFTIINSDKIIRITNSSHNDGVIYLPNNHEVKFTRSYRKNIIQSTSS